MTQLKEPTYEVIQDFIINIKVGCISKLKEILQQYKPNIVNKLDFQTRQPTLYFAAILIDHQLSYAIMKLLIDYGANANFKDNYQQTALFYVCREGKQKCLNLLLEQGLNLNDEDVFGQTPLFYVAKENRLNIIHKLLEKKVDVNHTDKIASQTPLFYAARQGNLEMCKVLLDAGSDISHQDSFHKSASHYAKKNQKNQVYEYLIAEYATWKEQKKNEPSIEVEVNQQQKTALKKKKDTPIPNITNQMKTVYRLYRTDALGYITELTIAELADLYASNPDLENMIKNPEEIKMNDIQQIKSKYIWIKYATKVLSVCWKAKGGSYFHEPVDPSRFNIIDYFDVIKEPMDFGTIKRKLNHNIYENVNQFIMDMNLVFDNCVRYNGTENPVAKYALQIKGIFEEQMKQMGYMN